MNDYAGNRWYKCDLHLHTASSKCYMQSTDTAKQWIERAAEQGLNVVAVTDHNDYRGISAVMEEGEKCGIAVFPGVEITCDSSKIHMIILFDTNKKAENVRDFLNRCDIDSDRVGEPDGTSLSVFEVCEIAKKRGAIVIAAHIDEFNSVSSMNTANLEKLFAGGYIDAVQVSNVPTWRKLENDNDLEAAQKVLAEKYGADATPQITERWRKCYNRARQMKIPMLAFSDNPEGPVAARHGLWGIGSVYTWIQMDDVIDLESIRQSLLTSESRIRMMYDSEDEPRTEPDFWLKSLEVRHSELNPHKPIRLTFHPQLNCIIGGKGSGKSSIVRIMLGVYRQLSGRLLKNTFEQQKSFYAQRSDESYGVFNEKSEIEICYNLYGSRYRMLVTDIKSMSDQKYTFYRLDPVTNKEVIQGRAELLFSALFCAQVFAQRKINEMTETPGALLACVDHSICDMHIFQAKKEYYLEELLSLSARYHAAKKFLEIGVRAGAELEWFEKMEKSESISEELRVRFPEMIKMRRASLKKFAACEKDIEKIKKQKTELLKKYENCFDEIRKARQDFIARVFEDDENYKIELLPMASRSSFKSMLIETLNGDEALMEADIKQLENILFSKNDGLKSFQEMLISIRDKNNGGGKSGDNLSAYFIHLIRQIDDESFERMLLFRPEDELVMYYHPNGVKRFFPMTTASSGEMAAALFSFVLSSNTTPLIIDQPEDGMDNRVIFEEVIKKLKKAKQRRQLIVITHNANITTNADPEMIISMDSWSKFVRVNKQGSVDNEEIRREICDVLEGTEEAFVKRAKKYNIE